MKSLFTAALLVSSLTALSACALFEGAGNTGKPVNDAARFSGYLVSYSDMSESSTPSGGTRLGWVSPTLQRGQYHSVIIDPIGFYPKPPLQSKVSKGRMLEVVQYLGKQAKLAVGRELKIVTQPGPGVLRVDAAITGAKALPGLQGQAVNLPVAGIFTDIAPNAVPPEHGLVVYLETRLLDSQTNRVLAKSVRAASGSPMADPQARIMLKDMQPVLDSWAQDAAAFIRERIKAKPSGKTP